MVMFKQGLEWIRDQAHDGTDDGQLGTDGGPVTEAGTGLNAAVAVTIAVLTKAKFTKGYSFDFTKAAAVSPSSTFREFEIRNTAMLSLGRAVVAPIPGNTEIDVTGQIQFIQNLNE